MPSGNSRAVNREIGRKRREWRREADDARRAPVGIGAALQEQLCHRHITI